MPVFRDSLDNIQGFVFVKDVIQMQGEEAVQRPVTSLMRPAHFVPETKRVSDLLKEFQAASLMDLIHRQEVALNRFVRSRTGCHRL